MQWDMLALQEPAIDPRLGLTKANAHWRVVYPTHKYTHNSRPRAISLINSKISTNNWKQIPFPSRDIVIIQFVGVQGYCTIINIYNDGTNNRTIELLEQFLAGNIREVRPSLLDHMLWLGDFNRHHPLWDEERNSHLFTRSALDDAQKLLDLIADYGMTQALPKDLPTLKSSSSGNWTRPDNVFCTDHSLETLTLCTTDPSQRGPKTDHVPILTHMNLDVPPAPESEFRNYREVDWGSFNTHLCDLLSKLPPPHQIDTEEDFQKTAHELDNALRATVESCVPKTKPSPHTKRWWSKDLTLMRKETNQLNRLSYKFRALPNHPCHKASKTARNKLADSIFKAKREHWQNWLEEATEGDVWTAHRYIKTPPGDGGRTRIPTLNGKADDGTPIIATTNQEKGELLAKTLFPPPPESSSVPADFNYPDPAEKWTPITREHLVEAIRKLNRSKAPGPDGIANIVFKKCPILVDRLLPIFNATLQLDTYYEPWRESTTVIIRKPGKPDYSIPKAYRPIALLNTTAKLLSALIADRVSYILETHNLLPSTHFGGRPGRSTTDSLHLLEATIRHAWRQGKVVSALFLDIEGAFPNAVTDRLLHNMRTRGLPPEVVGYTQCLLQGRRTRLRFDDFSSDWISITNGIGQGDPLSMILFIIYNSDLVDAAKDTNELTLAFVDDTAFIAIGKDFQETHSILVDMLEREGGGYQWSKDHNSKFETSKFALIDFSLNRAKERPPIHIRGITIKPTPSHKFLGVIIDQELRWREQASYSLGKGTEYTMLMRRISGASWGVPSKLTRQLYQAVVIPRVMYAASVWLRPTHNRNLDTPLRGSTGIAKKIGRTQRSAAMTILGAMHTSPLDSISKPRVNCPVLASTGQCYSAHSEGPHVEYLHRTIIVSIVCPSL